MATSLRLSLGGNAQREPEAAERARHESSAHRRGLYAHGLYTEYHGRAPPRVGQHQRGSGDERVGPGRADASIYAKLSHHLMDV